MRALTIKPVLLTAVVTMSLLSPAVWAAAAGKVTYAYGQAQAVNAAAQARPLVKGAEVQSGESVQTQQGRAQITFSDGGFVALQPNTAFKIDDYNYAGREDGSEHSFLNLLKGGMRFVTGAIGHRNKQNYKIKTVVATIGIRGSGRTDSRGPCGREAGAIQSPRHVCGQRTAYRYRRFRGYRGNNSSDRACGPVHRCGPGTGDPPAEPA